MIKVVITYQNKTLIRAIEVKGHAGSGPSGHDLVCAAVSAILTGGANELVNLDKNFKKTIELKEGYAKIENSSNDDRVNEAMQVIATMLKTVQESYSQFIRIEDIEN